MGKTSIEWTEHSASPIRARNKATGAVFHWCVKKSAGCAHCYAERLAIRRGLPAYVKANREKVEFFLDESVLRKILKRKKPTTHFIEDCSDLFGEWVRDEWLDKIFATMAMARHHTFQVLTKEPQRMRDYLLVVQNDDKDLQRFVGPACELSGSPCAAGIFDELDWPFRNVWLGVSVEDQQRKSRIDILRETPAALRFLSCEPLLEDLGTLDLSGISWVIVGGESGPGARPCNIQWIRDLVRQCRSASVPVFVKQLGAIPFTQTIEDWPHGPLRDLNGYQKTMDRKGGDPAEWPSDLRVREFPTVARPAVG